MRQLVARALPRVAIAGSMLAVIVGVVLAGPAHAAETEQATITVEGMYCPNCERTVEMLLQGIDGVESADADRARQQAQVTFDPARTSPAELAQAINTQTYYQASTAGQPAGNAGQRAQDQASSDGAGGVPVTALLVAGLLTAALLGSGLLVRRKRSASRQ